MGFYCYPLGPFKISCLCLFPYKSRQKYGMEWQYLRPNERYPVPLNESFWIDIICSNNIGGSAAVAHEMDQIYASNVASEVEKALRENKENIDNAIMKQVFFRP